MVDMREFGNRSVEDAHPKVGNCTPGRAPVLQRRAAIMYCRMTRPIAVENQ